MFVELDLIKPGDRDFSPKIEFPSEYPIIASRPSEMQRLVAGANEIVEKFNQIDAKGISDQLIATTKALEELITGKQITSILARVDAAAGNLDRLTARADKVLGDAGLDKTVAEAREALSGARKSAHHPQRSGPGHETPGYPGKNPGTRLGNCRPPARTCARVPRPWRCCFRECMSAPRTSCSASPPRKGGMNEGHD